VVKDGGALFVMGNEALVVLDVATGVERWSAEGDAWARDSRLTGNAAALFWGSARDRADGGVLWAGA
jgi:hypothetical protein